MCKLCDEGQPQDHGPDRSNVETVIVAGKLRKWKGQLLDVNLRKLKRELEGSRDRLFAAAGIPQDLFRAP